MLYFVDYAQETADYVLNQLSLVHSVIEKGLLDYSSDTHGAPGKYFDSLIVELQKAQKLLTDSARLLSSYQLEKSQASLNQLRATVEDTRKKVEPKKKFSFKSEKKKTVVRVILLFCYYSVSYFVLLNYTIYSCVI